MFCSVAQGVFRAGMWHRGICRDVAQGSLQGRDVARGFLGMWHRGVCRAGMWHRGFSGQGCGTGGFVGMWHKDFQGCDTWDLQGCGTGDAVQGMSHLCSCSSLGWELIVFLSLHFSLPGAAKKN